MRITTADIIAMTIHDRLDMGSLTAKGRPGDDEPPMGIPAG